ncbi:MAG: heme ABC transporter permease [Moraxellaceae bacterium]|nr:heme ABC transporter permease [Moraxellaceae bacterium]
MWKAIWDYVQRTVSPRHFYDIGGQWLPWLWAVAGVLLTVGAVWGLAYAPPDYQQGNSYRIIFIHVPAASIAMGGYVLMATCGLISLVWKVKTAEMVARSVAAIGAWFCLIALFTGAVWGKPTWGTYWVWDARLPSMLILLFLYLGVLGLYSAYESAASAGKAAAILALVGVVNLPIIKYSVEWWNTLHQGSTFVATARPTMPPEMYLPLIVMFFGCYAFFGAAVIARTRNEIVQRERRTQWVKDIVRKESAHGI